MELRYIITMVGRTETGLGFCGTVAAFAALVGCGPGVTLKKQEWRQVHSDSSNSGTVLVKSDFALASEWSAEVGSTPNSSPVVGADETIYLSNGDGELVAVGPDGNERWRQMFTNQVLSAPAVGPDDSVYVIANQPLGTDPQSYSGILHKRDGANGAGICQANLPGAAFSPPTVLGTAGSAYLFAISGTGLHVFNQSCTEVLTQQVGSGCPITGTSWLTELLKDILDLFKDAFDPTDPGIDFDESGLRPPSQPKTVAVAPIENSDGEAVVVFSRPCYISAQRFTPQPPMLTSMWSDAFDDPHYVSSPAISPGGIVVVGIDNGKVLAYDLFGESHKRRWEYDAGEPVLATPAWYALDVVVPSISKLHVLQGSTGNKRYTTELDGATAASPATSANRIHVSTSRAFESFTPDLVSSFHNGNVWSASASPAIGCDGTVYAVGGTRLYAFRGKGDDDCVNDDLPRTTAGPSKVKLP